MHSLLIFVLIIVSFTSFAASDKIEDNGSAVPLKKEFDITLSVDNKFKSSQDASTNVILSLVNSLAYVCDKNDWNDNIFQRLLTGYGASLLATANHEISGHVLRGQEFGVKTSRVEVNADLTGTTIFKADSMLGLHQQKEAIIDTAGMEANYVLSQKFLSDLVNKDQSLDAVTAAAYIFSAGDQPMYVFGTVKDKNNKKEMGNDVKHYIDNMQKLYGQGSITYKKIKSLEYLNLLDPMLFASLYSWGSGNNVRLPFLQVTEGLSFMPSARLVLTPYGVLEKRLIVYMRTDYTVIKASVGFGKESKTAETFVPILASGNHNTGIFTGSANPIKKNHTYYGELVVNKVIAFDKLKLGVTLAGWQQPELFVNNPYEASMKKGGMIILNSQYTLSDNLKIRCDLGYKNKGYVLGHPVGKTPLIRLGLKWTL